ncbi:hypothetical protein Scep_014207 [Stephania cephalantha]|uniref:Uncharacterized protein n=1 Tax=Stephania cephalantha TaxID=152367 RepID=A0AAP0J0S5_9MAGN
MEFDSLDGWWRYNRRACSQRRSSRTAAPAGSAAGADGEPAETARLRGGRPGMTTSVRLWFLAEFTHEERREREGKKKKVKERIFELRIH